MDARAFPVRMNKASKQQTENHALFKENQAVLIVC